MVGKIFKAMQNCPNNIVNGSVFVKKCDCPGAGTPEKLTNQYLTPSIDKHFSLDSEDDFHSGCQNVSHQQQSF